PGDTTGTPNTSLFWSWPAQRPVAIYTYDDVVSNSGNLPATQHYSVRGNGTSTSDAAEVGRYQNRRDILINWDRIGFVMQGPAISSYPADYSPDFYLEVASQFERDESNLVQPWPNTVTNKTYPPQN
ncbi:MAG TPA: hypothetical protein VFW53_02520, partial [Gallionella sp.]|nr:hypothetical protein [Gallionella sp.]